MRIWLLLAGLMLWGVLALQEGRPRVGAGIGWLQTGIVALAGGDALAPEHGGFPGGQHAPR